MQHVKKVTLVQAIKDIGVKATSIACGCSVRSIYKWMKKGSLPRTDYSGETDYAEKISIASMGKYSTELIKSISRPQKSNETTFK